MTQTQDEHSTSPEPYKTSDTPFAAYLHYRGYKVVGSVQDPNDYKREVIVFMFDENIPVLEKEWRASEANGELRRYYRSLKIVNRFVGEARKKRNEG